MGRGINVWLLTTQGYASPYWATIPQINELGGSVRRAEKSKRVVFWRIYVDGVEVNAGEQEHQIPEAEGQEQRPVCSALFFSFQHRTCELPASVTEKLSLPEQRQMDPIEACEKILTGMPNPPEIVREGDKRFTRR